mgnify:CR=1 FL=1
MVFHVVSKWLCVDLDTRKVVSMDFDRCEIVAVDVVNERYGFVAMAVFMVDKLFKQILSWHLEIFRQFS